MATFSIACSSGVFNLRRTALPTQTPRAMLGVTNYSVQAWPSNNKIVQKRGREVAVAATVTDGRVEFDDNPEAIISGEWAENFSLACYDDLREYFQHRIFKDELSPNMPIREVMSTSVRAATIDQTVGEIEHHFQVISGLPVMDEELRCVGIITKEDLGSRASATVDQSAIEIFVGITGASEAVASQKLKACRGDLNLAIDAYFNEANGVNSSASHCDDILNIEDDPMDVDTATEIPSFPQNTVTVRGQSIPVITSGSLFERPRHVREIPIVVKDEIDQSFHSMPRIEDVTGIVAENESSIHGTVIADDDDDDDDITVLPTTNSPVVDSLNNEIEEQMIMAAIEASKKETKGHIDHHFDVSHSVDEEAEYQQGVQSGPKGPSTSSRVNLKANEKYTTVNGKRTTHLNTTGTSIIYSSDDEEEDDEEEDAEERLVLRRRFQLPIEPHDNAVNNSVSEPKGPESQQNLPANEGSFQSAEWGGISSVEHDEAVMLEAAMFGGIPEGRRPYDFTYPSQISSDGHSALYPRAHRPPSPTLTAQRLLREQQDGEYLAALQADKDKELKAENEAHQKLQEKKEFESQLSAKEASLPPEPALDDENAITLLIRLPDGSRCGRRFLKSDKLQFLFNFIDTGRVVAPGTYRLVRPFPRRAFGEAENELSLIELGLTSKQEALFLELI